jgi:hypothetical protein
VPAWQVVTQQVLWMFYACCHVFGGSEVSTPHLSMLTRPRSQQGFPHERTAKGAFLHYIASATNLSLAPSSSRAKDEDNPQGTKLTKPSSSSC